MHQCDVWALYAPNPAGDTGQSIWLLPWSRTVHLDVTAALWRCPRPKDLSQWLRIVLKSSIPAPIPAPNPAQDSAHKPAAPP